MQLICIQESVLKPTLTAFAYYIRVWLFDFAPSHRGQEKSVRSDWLSSTKVLRLSIRRRETNERDHSIVPNGLWVWTKKESLPLSWGRIPHHRIWLKLSYSVSKELEGTSDFPGDRRIWSPQLLKQRSVGSIPTYWIDTCLPLAHPTGSPNETGKNFSGL